MSLHLRDVTNDDLPLIEQWLHADHVRSTWGDPGESLRLLNEPPANGNWRAIIEADGHQVGIVLWQHPTREELDVAGLTDIPTSVIDIDIMTNSRPYFDGVSDRWDEMRASFFSEKLRDKALASAEPGVGTLAADLGAGTGFMTEGLLKRGVRVIAVDQSQAMLDVLIRKLSGFHGIECRVGEAGRLPIEDGLVDSVFANMYLHHVEDPAEAIREMARILKPGGVLVITDLDEHDSEFLRLEHHDRWLGFRREDFSAWLAAAGLREVSVGCLGEDCCSDSGDGRQSARISIFIARAKKAGAPGPCGGGDR